MNFAGPKKSATLAGLFLMAAFGFAGLAASPAIAEDAPVAASSAAAPAADAKPAKRAPKAKRAKKSADAGRPSGSLESRHAVCLSFIQRHGLSCDPWVEPTCGAETGYFRPAECVRPRSQ